MTKCNLDWTHTDITVKDVRKLNKLYAIVIDHAVIKDPLFINEKIFEERLRSYFLKPEVSREEILKVKWNLHITQGYYIKVDEFGELKQYRKEGEENKYYVSYLEISGPLGTFHSTHREKE